MMVLPSSLKLFQSGNQAVVVGGMQTYRRLIAYIEHPHEPASYLGGQPYSLGFPSAQGSGGAVQGEVVQPYVYQETESGLESLSLSGGQWSFPGD